MALNPTLRQMVADSNARYRSVDPLAAKRAEILERQQEAEADIYEIEAAVEEFTKSVNQQLVELALRKATKKELLQIVRRAACVE